MTLLTTASSVSYVGNAVTKSFDFAFKVPEGALSITLTAADGTESAPAVGSYTVTGYDDANGGRVTFTTAPAAGATVTLYRSVDLLQEVTLTTGSAFYAEVIEAAFDKLAMVDQQQQAELDRAVKVPVGSDQDPNDLWQSLEGWRNDAVASASGAATISAANANASATTANSAATSAAASASTATTQASGAVASAASVSAASSASIAAATVFSSDYGSIL